MNRFHTLRCFAARHHGGAVLALAAGLLVAACGGGAGSGGTGSEAGQGTLRFGLTDAPACGYDAVHVTIEKIRVHRNATAEDGDAGWSEIVLDPVRRVDLLDLRNGVIEELGEMPVTAGTYSQLRLVLADNGSGPVPANSVTPTGGVETALTTPSAQQSGLKMNVNLEVKAGEVADFVLDFDACKSVVRRGNSGKYNLKPVITVIPRVTEAGHRVVGWVDPSIAAVASVSVQASGVPVKATAPALDGRFDLYPVPEGHYDLVVSATGRVNAVMTGVPVVATNYTYVSRSFSAILPPASAASAVTGTITPVTGTVRALQTLTGGRVYEAAWAPVDGLTGSFVFNLPTGAPVTTAYVPDVAPVFAADFGAQGLYTLEASDGVTLQWQDIDLSAPVAPVVFRFP